MTQQRSPRAPAPPRPITADIEEDTAFVGRMPRLFGTIWALIGGVGAILALGVALLAHAAPAWGGAMLGAITCVVGLVLLVVGRKSRAEAVEVFRDGVAVDAKVVSVALDKRVRVNKRSPWRITYAFDVNGKAYEGTRACWTDAKPRVSPGEHIVALHDANDPSRSVLWTRVTASAAADRGAESWAA